MGDQGERRNDGGWRASAAARAFFNPFFIGDDGPCYSLAAAETTPRISVLVVGGLMLLAHLMYMYGQLMPMWRLYYAVDLNVTLHATGSAAKTLFKEANLTNPLHIEMHEQHDVRTFTYSFAIKELWRASGLGSKFGPRLAAIVLVLFSGVWPHAKLLSLHFYWRANVTEITRTTAFYWLSTFGKWSLADVFVVCVMIGVLNLDLHLDPRHVREGLVSEIPDAVNIFKSLYTAAEAEQLVCQKALNLTCGHLLDLKCKLCEQAIGTVYNHPGGVEALATSALEGLETAGGGHMKLRIAGMHGIYVFSFAVVVSLVLSFFIDILDHRARAKSARERRGQPPHGALGVTGSPGMQYYSLISNEIDGNESDHGGAMDVRRPAAGSIILRDSPGSVTLIRRVSRKVWSLKQYVALVCAAWAALFIVLLGIFAPSMERVVPGSLPNIANRILGIEWGREYSLWSLTEVTGASGGPDFLLMATFGFFTVFGPILRALVCVIDLSVPMSKTMHRRTMTVVNFLGAFCAWEVFFVALFLVDMEMPPITNTILDSNDTPLCDIFASAGLGDSCFQVEFNVLDNYAFVVLGGTLLMLVASMAVKLGFKGLDPYLDGDRGGPYCCSWCPYVLFDFDRDLRQIEAQLESAEFGVSAEDTALLEPL